MCVPRTIPPFQNTNSPNRNAAGRYGRKEGRTSGKADGALKTDLTKSSALDLDVKISYTDMITLKTHTGLSLTLEDREASEAMTQVIHV